MRSSPWRLGLIPKTVGITILVVVPMTFGLARTATQQLEDKLTREFESKGEAVALSLAFSAASHSEALHDAIREVQGLIDAGSTIDGVAYIYIQDHEGSILAHTFRPTFPPAFEEVNWIEPGELSGAQRVKIAPSVDMEMADGHRIVAIDIAAPIREGRGGVVHVGMDRAAIEAPVNALRADMLAAGAIFAIAGMIFGAFLIAFWIVGPVRALHRATSHVVRTGDLSLDIVAKGHDEIGELMRSFATMLFDLRKSRAELDEANRTLTTRVQERTREVETQKADLESANRVLRTREEAQEAYSSALRTFNESTDLEHLLAGGLTQVAACAGTLLGAVHLCEPDGTFRTAATQTVGAEAVRSFASGEGFAGRAAEERKLLRFTGLGEDVWVLRAAGAEFAAREVVCVPMTVRERVVGVIELASVTPLDPLRIALLEPLAGQFAIAVANMTANAETRDLATRLEERNRTLTEQSAAMQRQQAELDVKNQELERASRVKSEFLASMSHELRTPMNSIIGYTDLVLNRASGLEARMRKNLEKVLGNAQHLLALINGILDLSKIEAGKMEIFLEPTDLGEVLESAATMSEVLLRSKPVKLVKRIDPGLPTVRADKTKLRQIVLNLLSNAAKFTDEGEVRLLAEVAGDAVVIRVEDTGVGIAPDELPLVFEEFRQVGPAAQRKGGTGLGLAIVKRMLEMMQGSIEVASTLGEGTHFTVRVPLMPALDRNAPAAPPAGPGYRETPAAEVEAQGVAAEKRPAVLVVDDEPDAIVLVRETLAGQPYDVLGAFSGEDALQLARKHQPFAILLDVMMPRHDGWEVLRRLKESRETSAIPVIMLTIVDNRPLAFRLGAIDYLTKPMDRDALLESLARVTPKPVKRVLVVDDEPSAREILSEVLVREGFGVTLAGGGEEGLAELEREIPDLVVLDLMMPGIDGFEVVARMRADSRWADVPVLVCSAKDLSAEERAILSRSVQRAIEKGSMDPRSLLDGVARTLGEIENTKVNGRTSMGHR